MGQLAKRKTAFNKNGNLQYCRKRTISLKAGKSKDYTDMINKAMQRLHKSGGGTLKLGKGTFVHKGQIRIPSFVCLVGSGMGSTTLKLANKAPKFRLSGNVRSFWTRRVTVMHLTIDGNRKKQRKGKRASYGRYGYFHELTNYVYLNRVRVRNNQGYGFDPHGSKKYWSYRLIIENCVSEGNGLDGFTIDQTIHGSLRNCLARNNDRHGFNIVTGAGMISIRNSRAYDNGEDSKVGFGFVAQNNMNFGTNRVIIERCTARNNFKGSIRLTDVKDVRLIRNKLSPKGKGFCYDFRKVRKTTLKSNSCSARNNRKFRKSKSSFKES